MRDKNLYILAVLLIMAGPALGGTVRYEFVEDQSTVLQHGGFAGVHITYSITGRFVLTVDFGAAVALFDAVHANLNEIGLSFTQDLNELFNMTELVGTVINDTQIRFVGKNTDNVPADVNLMVTLEDGSVQITGGTEPGCCDFFIYNIDAVAIESARTIYVDADANGLNDGSSWADAYNYLQDALADVNTSAKPIEIRVAEGIYTPDSNSFVPNGSGDRMATFQLISGVSLKGGYAGYGQPDPNARDIEFYESILSGDLDGNDVEVNDPCDLENEPTRAENSYHVVNAVDTDETTVLDGFTITAGNANGKGWPVYQNFGGGMYNDSDSPSVINCKFMDNSASSRGGGIYNWGGSPTLTNCTFSGNSAGIGGGIENNGGSPRLTDCAFIGNSARHSGGGMFSCCGWAVLILTNCMFKGNCSYGPYGQGGGICCDNGIMMMINCTFSGNSARYGGGMWYIDGNDRYQTLANCRFSGNSAYQGGGMFCTFSSPTVNNCTFSGNSAEYGEGIYVEDGSYPTLTNCILWGNRNTNGTDESAQFDYEDDFINYCCIEGWNGHLGGVGNIDADPCFVDPGYWEDPCNTPSDYLDDIWVEGDYHLKSQGGRWEPNSQMWVQDDVTSPCIDAGDWLSPIGLEPFPNGGRVNMGAFGGTAEASKSYFGKPVCEVIVAGDVNGDCIVNFLDFRIMALHWLEDKNPPLPPY